MKRPFPQLPLDHWPLVDRDRWRAAQSAGDFFDDEAGFAAGWRPETIRGCTRNYGAWLHWLDDIDQLDPLLDPGTRATKSRIQEFVAAYRVGRAEVTVASTVRDIAYVLRACQPPHGVAWLTKFAHRMVASARPSRLKLPRMARVADIVQLSDRLLAMGLERLRDGKRSGAPVYRDGLMIGLLIHRPMRRRNVVALKLGKNIFVDHLGIQVVFPPEETKKGVPIDFQLPKRLIEPFRTYLDHVRPLLLRAGSADDGWLWIGRRGNKMPPNDATIRVTKATRKYLGLDLSMHLFRDCVATEVALERATEIGITKDLLGHATLSSSQKFYNQATSITAFARLEGVIRGMRDDS